MKSDATTHRTPKALRANYDRHANNFASLKCACVLEKAGFVFEARLKNNVIKDGELHDSLLYAKTN